MDGSMLKITDLHAWYGHSHVVQGLSIEVGRGEIVSLIGRNGAGKTTTLRTIMGLVTKCRGTVAFDQHADILLRPTHARYHLGLGFVPEDRRIVPGLTVRENLQLGLIASSLKSRENAIIDRIAETFPRLKERLNQVAETMSGGEQQMLAIARATASEPKMILLDEPSEGIMPVLVDEMFALFQQMKAQGTTILLVEQNVERALAISDRAYIMDQGLIVHHAPASVLLSDKDIQDRYCAI
jgi:branched-chain amino acid transport system ATP-binding protein